MAKAKTSFFCSECGSELSKWAGQCPDCKAWNTVKEFRQAAIAGTSRMSGFTGTTGTDETGKFTGAEFQVNTVEGGEFTTADGKSFYQILDLNDR